jgi:hypothetical protein
MTNINYARTWSNCLWIGIQDDWNSPGDWSMRMGQHSERSVNAENFVTRNLNRIIGIHMQYYCPS